jgi:Tfp pilus assembly protein FimV
MQSDRANLMRMASLLFILVWATSPLAFTQGMVEDNVASTIRGLEHDWVDGQSRNDNRALDLIFDNALVYIEYGRLVTKNEYLLRVRMTAPSPPQIAMEAMTVRMFGGTAIVVGTYREKGIANGKPSSRHWRFVDTWVNKKGRWMLVAAAASPLSK